MSRGNLKVKVVGGQRSGQKDQMNVKHLSVFKSPHQSSGESGPKFKFKWKLGKSARQAPVNIGVGIGYMGGPRYFLSEFQKSMF